MMDPTDRAQIAHRSCSRGAQPGPAGAGECPACVQSLCPQCAAAVGQHWPSCMACGATWDLLCPEYDAVVRPRDLSCPQCGTSPEGEAEPAPVVSAPPSPSAVRSAVDLGLALTAAQEAAWLGPKHDLAYYALGLGPMSLGRRPSASEGREILGQWRAAGWASTYPTIEGHARTARW